MCPLLFFLVFKAGPFKTAFPILPFPFCRISSKICKAYLLSSLKSHLKRQTLYLPSTRQRNQKQQLHSASGANLIKWLPTILTDIATLFTYSPHEPESNLPLPVTSHLNCKVSGADKASLFPHLPAVLIQYLGQQNLGPSRVPKHYRNPERNKLIIHKSIPIYHLLITVVICSI